MKEMLANY